MRVSVANSVRMSSSWQVLTCSTLTTAFIKFSNTPHIQHDNSLTHHADCCRTPDDHSVHPPLPDRCSTAAVTRVQTAAMMLAVAGGLLLLQWT